MRYIALLAVVAVLFISAGCTEEGEKPVEAKTPPTFTKEQMLPSDVERGRAGVGVAIKDMDGDGDLDIIVSSPSGVKYFENVGGGSFTDQGKIAESGAEWGRAGVGVAIDDLDGDGILDIVVASPSGVRIMKNPIAQKN